MATDLNGVINSMAYGFRVTVCINGKDIGIAGGKSEGKRLFNTDHSMRSQMPKEMAERLAVLKEGENQIAIEYEKVSETEPLPLEITLQVGEYLAPLFTLKVSTKKSGRVERVISILPNPPADFVPVEVTE